MNRFVLLSAGSSLAFLSAAFFLSLPSTALSAGFTSSASSTGMSAASAGSNSLRASSGAISTSSTSSTGGADVAAGQYRLAAMRTNRAMTDALATVRLTLTPIVTDADGFEFDLRVPEQVIAQHQMKPGDTIHVASQPFGLEFAHGADKQSFFLVLAEEWERSLGTYQLQR